MTIVCALKQDDDVWMASDTRIIGGVHIYPEVGKKIYRCGKWLIGCSGSSRFGELFEGSSGTWTNPKELRDAFFFDLKKYEFVPRDDRDDKGQSPSYWVELLAASPSGLWGIASNGAIWEPQRFGAIGSGAYYAYGSMQALLSIPDVVCPDPSWVVRRGVEIAMVFNADCGGEVVVERLSG